MLTGIVEVERGATAPVAAWWQGALFLAYRSQARISICRLFPDADDVASSATVARLEWTCTGNPGLAAANGQLWLTWIEPAGQLNFAASTDGAQFRQVAAHAV